MRKREWVASGPVDPNEHLSDPSLEAVRAVLPNFSWPPEEVLEALRLGLRAGRGLKLHSEDEPDNVSASEMEDFMAWVKSTIADSELLQAVVAGYVVCDWIDGHVAFSRRDGEVLS